MKSFAKLIIEDLSREILAQMNSRHYTAVTQDTAPFMMHGGLIVMRNLGFIEHDDVAEAIYQFVNTNCRESKLYKRLYANHKHKGEEDHDKK